MRNTDARSPLASLLGQLLRFTVVGSANTAIDFGLFNLLVISLGSRSGPALYAVNALTLVLAMVFSYWANGRFTFARRAPSGSFPRFALVSVLALAVNSLVFALLVHTLTLPGLLQFDGAKLLAGVVSGALNFFGYRSFVYCRRTTAPSSPLVVRTLSLVIPAFNEERRLGGTLDSMRRHMDASPWDYEVLVVDDGSRDGTAELVRKRMPAWPNLRLVRLRENFGKGRAVRVGLGAARKDAVLYTDADDSVSLDNLPSLVGAVESGADLAIGLRPDPWRSPGEGAGGRRLMGQLYRLVTGVLFLPGYRDPQCGFKLLRRSAIPALVTRSHVDGFAFDVELLKKAVRRGLALRQVPVTWTPREGSSVRPLRELPRTALDLLQIALGSFDASLGLAGLIAAADIPLRLASLWSTPALKGEALGVALAFHISHGSAALTDSLSPHIGPIFGDLMALLFFLAGSSVYLPRLLVMGLSVGTVGLTFLLGRRLVGRGPALFASALLATCEVDILSTHMAWSSGLTPFFTVLAAYLLLVARKRGGWFWPGAGLALALAAQSDATVLAALPAFLAAAWWGGAPRRHRLLFWGGHVAFLAGYAEVLLRAAPWAHLESPYALVSSPAAYLHRALGLLSVMGRSVLSLPSPHPSGLLPAAFVWLIVAMLVYGAVLLVRRGARLPSWVLMSSWLVLPAFDRNFASLSGFRFVDDLLPFGMLAIAFALATLARKARLVGPRPKLRWGPAWVGLLALVMVLRPVPILAGVYHDSTHRAVAVRAAFSLATVLDQKDAHHPVVLEPGLAQGRYLPDLLACAGVEARRGQGSLRPTLHGVFVMTPETYRRLVRESEARDGNDDFRAQAVHRTYVVVRLPAT